jgi:hypothetical protein
MTPMTPNLPNDPQRRIRKTPIRYAVKDWNVEMLKPWENNLLSLRPLFEREKYNH